MNNQAFHHFQFIINEATEHNTTFYCIDIYTLIASRVLVWTALNTISHSS